MRGKRRAARGIDNKRKAPKRLTVTITRHVSETSGSGAQLIVATLARQYYLWRSPSRGPLPPLAARRRRLTRQISPRPRAAGEQTAVQRRRGANYGCANRQSTEGENAARHVALCRFPARHTQGIIRGLSRKTDYAKRDEGTPHSPFSRCYSRAVYV